MAGVPSHLSSSNQWKAIVATADPTSVLTALNGSADGSVSAAKSGYDPFAKNPAQSVVTDLRERAQSIKRWKTSTGDLQTALADALASGEKALSLPFETEVFLEATRNVPADVGIVGYGKTSKISTAGAGSHLLTVTGDDVIVDGVAFTCSAAGFFSALRAVNRTGILVRRCRVQGHKGTAFYFENAIDCIVERVVSRSSGITFPATQADTGYDIFFSGAALRNTVRHCDIASGHGIGIGFQTKLGEPATVADNWVVHNRVRDSAGYGIMLYGINNPPSTADTYKGNLIGWNQIANVTGDMTHTTDGAVYGSGIYVQSADDTTVIGNEVDGAHTSLTQTFIEQLAPGCIGVATTGEVRVVGNKVKNGGKWGFYISNVQQYGDGDAIVHFSGNTAHHCVEDGLKTNHINRIMIDDNVIWRCKAGIYLFGGPTVIKGYAQVGTNTIRECDQDGLRIVRFLHSVIDGLWAEGNDVHGFAISGGGDLYLKSLTTQGNTARGVSIGVGVNVREWGNVYATGNTPNFNIDASVVIPGSLHPASDANLTLSNHPPRVLRLSVPITAARTIGLPSDPPPGWRCRFERTSAATGAFAWNIGSPAAATPAIGAWAIVMRDHVAAAWVVAESGTL